MNVKTARERATQWVLDTGCRLPGFAGAYTVGSVNWLADEDEHPVTSDVDVKVVLDVEQLPENSGKFVHLGVLLDVSFVAFEALRSPEDVLGHYHLAAGFCKPGVIVDPTGHLTQLHSVVAREYAKRLWVERRCEHVRVAVLDWIGRIQQARHYHDQVTCWLFAAGAMAHLVLVAGLENPTIRRRYQAARQVLARCGHLDYHETLLACMGCAHLTRERVEQHLDAVADVFDCASRVIVTPYRFAGDISARGRPVSIGGSRGLIERGMHREAVFWLVTTYSRCQAVLMNDASVETREKYARGYGQLLSDLGIGSFDDLNKGGEQIRDALPRLGEIAQAIIEANPQIEDRRSAD